MTEIKRMARLLCEADQGAFARSIGRSDEWVKEKVEERWTGYSDRAEDIAAAGLTLIRREPTDADLERVAAVYLMDDWEISADASLARVRRNREAEHFGDCTDVASSCLRCAVDDALKLARAAYRTVVEGGE